MSVDVSWQAAEGWRRDAVHYPSRPVYPLDASFLVETVGAGSGAGMDEWSLPVGRIVDLVVNGWVYTRIEPFGNPPRALTRFGFLAHLWRVVPPLRRRVRGFQRFLLDGGFEARIATWDERWKPDAETRLAVLRSFDVAGASAAQLAAHLEAWRAYMVWQWSPHIRIHLVCFSVRGRFEELCARVLGLSGLECYELVKRRDPVLLEPSRKLAAIAARASEDEIVTAALRKPAPAALEALRGTWFERALDKFFDEHGDVPVDGFAVSLPTWREEPARIVGIVQTLVDHPYDPAAKEQEFQDARRARVAELRAKLAGDDLALFDRWLALAERAYPLNDSHNYLLFELPSGLIRYAALRAGELLASAGRIGARDDVLLLTLDELTTALRDGSGGDLRTLSDERREQMRRWAALEPPDAIGPEEALPPFHVFPKVVGDAMRILVEQSEKMYGQATPRGALASPGCIEGIAGSPGVAEGEARVVHTLEELDKVRPGDILVCPITGPAWTVVFPVVAGLVTDAGGSVSHPAIVAREYGIPSVVGTRCGTTVLRDGMRVRVDGTAGEVRVLADV